MHVLKSDGFLPHQLLNQATGCRSEAEIRNAETLTTGIHLKKKKKKHLAIVCICIHVRICKWFMWEVELWEIIYFLS